MIVDVQKTQQTLQFSFVAVLKTKQQSFTIKFNSFFFVKEFIASRGSFFLSFWLFRVFLERLFLEIFYV